MEGAFVVLRSHATDPCSGVTGNVSSTTGKDELNATGNREEKG